MLVLTRKLMEKLYIGDDICVTVVRLEGGQVRLGNRRSSGSRGRASRTWFRNGDRRPTPIGPVDRSTLSPRHADRQILTIRGSWSR